MAQDRCKQLPRAPPRTPRGPREASKRPREGPGSFQWEAFGCFCVAFVLRRPPGASWGLSGTIWSQFWMDIGAKRDQNRSLSCMQTEFETNQQSNCEFHTFDVLESARYAFVATYKFIKFLCKNHRILTCRSFD